jgi:hypothetical protein
MSDEEFEDDAEPVEDDDLAEDDVLDPDLAEDDDLADDDLADDALETEELVPVVDDAVAAVAAVAAGAPAAPKTKARGKKRRSEADEDEGLELDEELHPDDVEAPLDALLQEKTAAATMEDEEEELEDEEPDGDALVDGPAKIVPRRPGEFVCRSCFLVLPRHQLADEERMLCRDCA